MSVSKTDISQTLFYKNYFELTEEETIKVDKIYESHLELRKKAEKIFGKE